MMRYNVIRDKNPREIVLLKSTPCKWGRCSFCDYIDDNSLDQKRNTQFNKEVLKNVNGEYKQLEVINSASVFDLSMETLRDIKDIIIEKDIHTVYFESHFMYREKLGEIRELFPNTQIIFKCGIETFDRDFRENVLKKGANFSTVDEVTPYFNSICLMVGIQGQTKDMIRKDMEIMLDNFDKACINVYIENTSSIKPDPQLIKWFREEYSYLEKYEHIEILWNNTDYGVGD